MYPDGLFLSGGNDSAILLAMLRRWQSQPIRTFSIGYLDAEMQDELSDAEGIARAFGSDHTSLRIDRSALFRRVPHMVWAADDLMRDYASLPTSALSESAAKELKVVFTGEGGDEVFAGYRRYRQPGLVRWFRSLVAPGSAGFRTRSHWRRRRCHSACWAPELAARRSSFRRPFLQAWAEAPRSWSHLQRCQHTDLVTALTDNLLVKVDRMMMGFGIEGRVPFLDHRVVEFGLSLPDRLKVMPGQPKVFLRRWAERYVPRDHLYKKKRGFSVPVGEWLRGDFLGRLEHKLQHNPAVREWFETRYLAPLFQAQRRSGNAGREIVCLMQFAIWHRLFIEQPGVRPTPEEDPLEWIS